MAKRIQEVYKTNDYSIFKKLIGNRDVTKQRVKTIIESIEHVGYIPNPIICNERLEIIDGQGRLEALKELGLPVEYIIASGVGIEECKAMNLKPTSWTVSDFVKSYVEQGNEEYIKLVNLKQEYGVSCCVVYGISKNRLSITGEAHRKIKSGEYTITNDEYKRTDLLLSELCEYKNIIKKIGGKTDTAYVCLGWVLNREGVNKKHLYKALNTYCDQISPVANVPHFLKNISECYNKGLRVQDKRYFEYEYKMKK